MARIRTIKPDFFTSEDIVGLSMAARLLYIALWCEADREGRMQWKPRTFKLRYFPGDNIDVDACARELLASRLVITYGDGLAYIPTFAKHQHVNPRESQSTLPKPEIDASGTRDDASVTHREEWEGKERKGTDIGAQTEDDPPDLFPASPATPARRSAIELRTWLDSLPEDEDPIQADDPIIAYAEQAGIRHDWLVLCWSRFKADMIERKTKKKDWRAHFRNAVRANWYRLWWIRDGQSGLTTVGEQARRAA